MTHLRVCALLPVLLAMGCTTGPVRPEAAAAPAEVFVAASAPDANLPPNVLSAALIYDLLTAEIAAQRGDFALAAANYLAAAWETRDPRVAKRAVRLAIAANRSAEGLEAADLWVELEKESSEARQILSALLIRAGRADEALPHLEFLLQASKEDTSQGFDAVVGLLSRESDKALALSLLEQLAKTHASDPNAQFAHAQLAFMLGKHDMATADVEALLKQRPSWPKALVLKATIERHQGKLDAALKSFKAAVDAEPEDAGLRLSYARLLVDSQRYEDARRQFETLQRQLPDNADIMYALGLLGWQMEDLPRAEGHFRKLLETGERTDEAAYALGQIAERRQKWDDALRWYEAVAGGPNLLESRLRAAAIVERRSGLDAARNYLRALHTVTPESTSRLVLAETELLRNADKFQEAMAVLDAALEAAPEDTDLLYARAMVAERLGRLELLERDLRSILSREPDNAQALNALGYTLADRTTRYQEAFDLVKRALDQHPDDMAINDSMGWVLFRMGRYAEAEPYLTKAAVTKDPEVAAHLGELYWVTGRQDEARRVWNEALKEVPDSPIIKTVIERLAP